MKPYELFHEIADPSSARVRRYVLDHGLQDQVRFRNVFYPEVVKALEARGGGGAPALWDGETLVFGAEAIISRLSRHLNIGREP